MNGNRRYILDTNAIISLLSGNLDLAKLLDSADYVGISVISYFEFLVFDGLTEKDRDCFYEFCDKVEVVPLNNENKQLVSQVMNFRKHRLKLPDAIIAATATVNDAVLITNDTHFATAPTLIIQNC
jgi:tRNA(fMet)-specific endonuclease VapC